MRFISKYKFFDLIKYNNFLGISNDLIIENQAIKFIKNVDVKNRHTFAVIVGTGINGAIGLAIARHLVSLKKDVKIFVLKTEEKVNDDFEKQLKIIKNIKISINNLETLNELSSFPNDISKFNTIIDSIVGIDYNSNYISGLEYIIESINKARIYIMSVDIPSGLDYDLGRQLIEPVYSDIVITYHGMKEALNFNMGLYKTKIIIENIGLLERE